MMAAARAYKAGNWTLGLVSLCRGGGFAGTGNSTDRPGEIREGSEEERKGEPLVLTYRGHAMLGISNVTLSTGMGSYMKTGCISTRHVLRDVLYIPTWPEGDAVSLERFVEEMGSRNADKDGRDAFLGGRDGRDESVVVKGRARGSGESIVLSFCFSSSSLAWIAPPLPLLG